MYQRSFPAILTDSLTEREESGIANRNQLVFPAATCYIILESWGDRIFTRIRPAENMGGDSDVELAGRQGAIRQVSNER